MKKVDLKKLIVSVGIPIFVGWLSSFLSGNIRGDYLTLNQPPLAPPSWVFGVVWGILFTLMGIAFYLIITSDTTTEERKPAINLYFAQLIFNLAWPIIFFGFEMYLFAFLWLLVLLVLIGMTIVSFYKISPRAAYLLVPYFLWVAFAGYLNLGIYILN